MSDDYEVFKSNRKGERVTEFRANKHPWLFSVAVITSPAGQSTVEIAPREGDDPAIGKARRKLGEAKRTKIDLLAEPEEELEQKEVVSFAGGNTEMGNILAQLEIPPNIGTQY